LISLINDYSLFGAHDNEIIQMLSKKIGKKISETHFYRLKKEAVKKRGDSEQWLDYYARYQFVEFYRKRIEELELVQRKLLKVLIEETDKQAEKQDKTIIIQLSKTYFCFYHQFSARYLWPLEHDLCWYLQAHAIEPLSFCCSSGRIKESPSFSC
jgi:hypothetical protein